MSFQEKTALISCRIKTETETCQGSSHCLSVSATAQCSRVVWNDGLLHTCLLFELGLDNKEVSHQDEPDCEAQ